jgi:hypothetical protein
MVRECPVCKQLLEPFEFRLLRGGRGRARVCEACELSRRLRLIYRRRQERRERGLDRMREARRATGDVD